MKIREVQISGFRSLWNVSITNLGDVNVFFGENNSGKSNILEALEMLFRVERTDLPISGFYQGELTNFVDNFTVKPDGTTANVINMNCKVAIGSEDIGKLSGFIDFLKGNGIFKTHNQWIQLEVEIKPVTASVANRVLKKATINDCIMYDSSAAPPARFFPSLVVQVSQAAKKEDAAGALVGYLINSFSKIHTGRFMETGKIVEGSATNLLMQMQDFKDWFRTLIESRGEDYGTFRKIQEWFKQKPFAYGEIRPILSGGKTELIIEDTWNRELIMERLGIGVQQILVLLSQIAFRVSRYKTKIFGIEELELNLSPSIQMETLNMIKGMVSDPGSSGFSQVFLTSHSPYLCSRDCPDLYAVSIDKNAGTQVKHGPNVVKKMIKHYNYDFFK